MPYRLQAENGTFGGGESVIYELRTYTLKAGALRRVLKLFEERISHRLKYSPLGGFWITEIGPLNQVVHLWPYESVEQRAAVRSSFVDDPNWPPPIMGDLVEMRSEVIAPFPSLPALETGELGPIYELRSYLLEPGSGPAVREIWATKLEARSRLSKPLLIGTTDFGVLNTLIHIWPYESFAQRAAVRAKAVDMGVWPPPTAPYIRSMSNLIMLPASFSPLQ